MSGMQRGIRGEVGKGSRGKVVRDEEQAFCLFWFTLVKFRYTLANTDIISGEETDSEVHVDRPHIQLSSLCYCCKGILLFPPFPHSWFFPPPSASFSLIYLFLPSPFFIFFNDQI